MKRPLSSVSSLQSLLNLFLFVSAPTVHVNGSRLLQDVPLEVFKRNVLPFMNFNTTTQWGRVNRVLFGMVDEHLLDITRCEYEEALTLLNMTLDAFILNFPYFDCRTNQPVWGTEMDAFRSTFSDDLDDSARHHILAFIMRQTTDDDLIIKMHHQFVFVGGVLVEYQYHHSRLINGSEMMHDTPPVYDRKECIKTLRSQFRVKRIFDGIKRIGLEFKNEEQSHEMVNSVNTEGMAKQLMREIAQVNQQIMDMREELAELRGEMHRANSSVQELLSD